MDRPQILLVGVGGYGRIYLDALTQKELGADIVGIVETAPDILERRPVIAERKLPLYATLDAFYAEHSADLAVIVAPIHLHTEMAMKCMRNGSHVLCEKPLCLTLEEEQELERCSAETGRFLAVGYQLDYQRDVWALKEDILSGRFGAPLRVRVAHAFRRGKAYYARNDWAGRITAEGREVLDSPFHNACAHNFQMMCFLLGKDRGSACEIVSAEGELYRGNPTVENYDIATLRFRTDTGVQLLYYTAHPLRTDFFGPFGVMEFERAVVSYGGDMRFRAMLEDGSVIDYGRIPRTPEIQKLVDAIACVREGGVPICTAATDRCHIQAVRLAQRLPIRDVDPSHVDVVEENGDTYWYVHGLEEKLLACAENWVLPSEIGVEL